MQDQLESEAQMTRLLRLAGAESIARNLETEDRKFAQDMLGQEQQAEEDPMRITSAGNVTIYQTQATEREAQVGTTKESVTAAVPSAARGLARKLAPLALAAALGAMGGLAPALWTVYNASRPAKEPAAVVQPAPVDVAYKVTVFDQDGNPIRVDIISATRYAWTS